MNQKSLSVWLKVITVGLALIGLAVYLLIIPACGQSIVSQYPEFSDRYLPWLIFISLTAVPVFWALVLVWLIAANIGADRSFTVGTAGYMKWISWLAAADSAFFFLGSIVMLLLNMSHPGVALISMMFVFLGAAIAAGAAALSHMIRKAAVLQEQSDLTI